jgi:60 kDa SS-A/Ro ribonucleoprotein
MKTNSKKPTAVQRTAGGAGAVAAKISPEMELRRLTAACMLWEDNFYEQGIAVSGRIKELVPRCDPDFLYENAIEMRTKQHLRHAPLMLVREMARHDKTKGRVAKLLPQVILRADELSEFVAIYWQDGRAPLSAQVKRGLAEAFGKFDEYQLAKYNRAGPVKLRDVLFLSHAKAKDAEQDALWKRLIEGTLATPDTWEVGLSAGQDKRETFERLMADGNLGGLAFLRNLRGMQEAGVPLETIAEYGKRANFSRVLPFRFIGAAMHTDAALHPMLSDLFLRNAQARPKLPGKTVVVVDTSGSMFGSPVSAKSDLTRVAAGASLAAILRESCEQFVLYVTADNTSRVMTDARGVELVGMFPSVEFGKGTAPGYRSYGSYNDNTIFKMVGGGGIYTNRMLEHTKRAEGEADRLIVVTDEQDCDYGSKAINNPWAKVNYLLNVSTHRNGVAYGDGWVHIDGWSEAVIDYMFEAEAMFQQEAADNRLLTQ